jgi:hypothetical protein
MTRTSEPPAPAAATSDELPPLHRPTVIALVAAKLLLHLLTICRELATPLTEMWPDLKHWN